MRNIMQKHSKNTIHYCSFFFLTMVVIFYSPIIFTMNSASYNRQEDLSSLLPILGGTLAATTIFAAIKWKEYKKSLYHHCNNESFQLVDLLVMKGVIIPGLLGGLFAGTITSMYYVNSSRKPTDFELGMMGCASFLGTSMVWLPNLKKSFS